MRAPVRRRAAGRLQHTRHDAQKLREGRTPRAGVTQNLNKIIYLIDLFNLLLIF